MTWSWKCIQDSHVLFCQASKNNNEMIKILQVEVAQHLKETDIPKGIIMQNRN